MSDTPFNSGRLYVGGKRVPASRLEGARSARWEVIRLAWAARSESYRGDSPERRAAGALLGRLLGDASRVDQVTNQLGPRVTGGDPVAVAASRLLAELHANLAEQEAAA